MRMKPGVKLSTRIKTGVIQALGGVFLLVMGTEFRFHCRSFQHASECVDWKQHLPEKEWFIAVALFCFIVGFVEAGKTMAEAFGRNE
jgi:hypothetical protein